MKNSDDDEGHNHDDQPLASNPWGAEATKSQRWVDLPEKGEHVHVLDPSLPVRIVLSPRGDKLVKMVRSQY